MRIDRKILIGAGATAGALLAYIALRSKNASQGPLTPADVAERELVRWEGLTEHDPGADPILREYWASTGQYYPGADTPWSGAFITNAVRSSSIPDALLPSGAHTVYAFQAYRDRGVPGRYGMYRPEEVQVRPGDIVIRGRDDSGVTFDSIRAGVVAPSHGDIVTAVSPSAARAIGGNMGLQHYSTVKARVIPHNGGVITDPAVVAVLRYQPFSGVGLRFP